MSFNIRWDEEKPDIPKWSCRKEQVASLIRFHQVDIVGLQEPLYPQIRDLQEILPEYECFGCRYERTGLHDPILFRKNRFIKLQGSYFYLSPTPESPSKGWNAKFLRGVTWIKLKDRKRHKIFYFFNTHFDYHSFFARTKSALLLREKITEITKGAPFLVTGDFNLFPELGGENTFKILTSEENDTSRSLVDAKDASFTPHHGPTGTWSGFSKAGDPGIKPDYIFVDKEVKVFTHGILSDNFDGAFASDHLPVVADVSV